MRFVRARDTVTLVAALSLMLSAGPAHALACLVDAGADNTLVPPEAPCHPPAHDETPAHHGPQAPPDGGPSMSCCIAPAGVVRALERPAQTPVAVLAARLAQPFTPPAVSEVGGHAYRPPAPPGPLHLLYGCFLT